MKEKHIAGYLGCQECAVLVWGSLALALWNDILEPWSLPREEATCFAEWQAQELTEPCRSAEWHMPEAHQEGP